MSETNLPIKKWEKVTETRISYDSNTGERREDVSRWIAIKDEKQGLPVNVCLVHESPLLSKEEVEANENMIAAAPEMYEALKNLVEIFDPQFQSMYSFAKKDIDNAKYAIMKARGLHE